MSFDMSELDRRGFLGLAAAAAAIGVAAAAPAVNAAETKTGAPTPFTKWLDSISGKQRALLDVREPGGGMGNAWAWVYLATAPQAYGIGESDLNVVMVLRHNAIPLALGDAAWSKYKLGEMFKIEDHKTKAPALRHPFLADMPPDFLPDMSLEKLIARGVKVAACDMAIFYYSGVAAKSMGLKHEDVQADWNANLVPGIVHVPSGVVACQGAVARGASYIYAG